MMLLILIKNQRARIKRPFVLSGFSLLEVMIGVFILAFGLFGIMGIYLNSFKSMEDSYQRTLEISKTIAKYEEI